MRKYPKRTKSHQIGDKAKGQIIDAFFSKGWVVEEVTGDYGEDLVLQIADKGQLLPLRVYIQLKGTEDIQKFKKRNGVYTYSNLKTTTAAHWLDSIDLTTLILWDVKKMKGSLILLIMQ